MVAWRACFRCCMRACIYQYTYTGTGKRHFYPPAKPPTLTRRGTTPSSGSPPCFNSATAMLMSPHFPPPLPRPPPPLPLPLLLKSRPPEGPCHFINVSGGCGEFLF